MSTRYLLLRVRGIKERLCEFMSEFCMSKFLDQVRKNFNKSHYVVDLFILRLLLELRGVPCRSFGEGADEPCL